MSILDVISAAIRSHQLESAETHLTETTAANLSVYASAYLATLRESLERAYPVTRQLLGEKNFRYFARRYCERHPPLVRSIDHFGELFPEHLKSEPQLMRSQPALLYFAQLDWFHHHPLAPEAVELELPAGLPAAYDQLRHSGSLSSTRFGACSRHRLVRSLERG